MELQGENFLTDLVITVTRSTAVNRMRQSESWNDSWTIRQNTSDPSGSVIQCNSNGTHASAM